MLVSARVTPQLRSEARDGLRPCPEYLRLESTQGVRLLDWTEARVGAGGGRSATRSLRHVHAALGPVRRVDAVLSDGEHLGIPLALCMQALGVRVPHLMIGHHLTTFAKAPCFRVLHAERRIDRILVHSARQMRLARHRLGLSCGKVAVVPYGIDTEFWRPQSMAEEPLIAAPGREHRDHRTLAKACARLPARVFVSEASAHNPRARHSAPVTWPANVELGTPDYLGLRQLYARAQVIAVPLAPADFPAGITTILEAMSMGKPMVVSATAGLAGLVRDGETGLLVPPGDAPALRTAIHWLLSHPKERRRIGANAREEAVTHFNLELYALRIGRHLNELTASRANARNPEGMIPCP
jgi:glycosyltransferase involved in cell wall biosynthesis